MNAGCKTIFTGMIAALVHPQRTKSMIAVIATRIASELEIGCGDKLTAHRKGTDA
jgi:hypothetical protein